MIRSQVLVLNVMYDDTSENWPGVEGTSKLSPSEWNWSDLVDEPIRNAVEILAAGPLKDYPTMDEAS